MNNSALKRRFLLVASLAMLSLRALTPDGYMPGSAQSGLLYELCPDGMPAEIMQLLAGGQHHHHHADADDSASVSGTEQCPIGHMLASATVTDSGAQSEVPPDAAVFSEVPLASLLRASVATYRSRAPPA